MGETAKFANVVLPGASFFEKSGTFTNGGRRVQRVNEVIPPPDYTPDGVLAEIARVASAQAATTCLRSSRLLAQPSRSAD